MLVFGFICVAKHTYVNLFFLLRRLIQKHEMITLSEQTRGKKYRLNFITCVFSLCFGLMITVSLQRRKEKKHSTNRTAAKVNNNCCKKCKNRRGKWKIKATNFSIHSCLQTPRIIVVIFFPSKNSCKMHIICT